MINLHCAICGKNEFLSVLYKSTLPKNIKAQKFSARKTPDRIHYQLNICNNCGLIFSSPILPGGKIAKLYKDSSYTYLNHLPFLKKTYLGLFNKARKYLPKRPLNVLDIGSSNGFFLEGLKEVGIKNVYGVEPSREEAKNAPVSVRENIKVDVFKKNQFPHNFFDVVCCFHTLDHIVSVNSFLTEAHNILKKNGLCVFVVHDTNGLSVKLFKERSPIFDVQHIYLFNKETLKNIFEKNNFEVLEVSNLKNTFSLEFWLNMSPFPNLIKKFGLDLFNLFGLCNKALSLSAGNIMIIARKSVTGRLFVMTEGGFYRQ
jgi:SAM-dependent methyltransferase